MKWIKQSEKEPTEMDLPFVTYGKRLKISPEVIFNVQELWEDLDWFYELEEEERLEWKYWMHLEKPE